MLCYMLFLLTDALLPIELLPLCFRTATESDELKAEDEIGDDGDVDDEEDEEFEGVPLSDGTEGRMTVHLSGLYR